MSQPPTSLRPPSHIVAAGLAVPTIRYVWRDWQEVAIYRTSEADDALLERLDELPYRALLGLTIAAAEWIVYRYEGLADIGMHLQYIEAAWATTVDDRYLRTWDPDEDECSGPLHGPLAYAMVIVQDAVHASAMESEAGLPVVYVSNLAQRVLPAFEPFKAWRDGAIERLLALALRDWHDTLGEVVPREFFDAAEGFVPAQREALVRRFMHGLDTQVNPWLHTSEELELQHFDGPLFDFDAAGDREARELG